MDRRPSGACHRTAGLWQDDSAAAQDILLGQCHNTNKRRGGLDLEKITETGAIDAGEMWDQVRERLVSKRDAAVAKNKKPTESEQKTILAWVKHVADSQVSCGTTLTARATRQARWPAIRLSFWRLNRAEYNNTLCDLFGVDVHAGDLLPLRRGRRRRF